MKPKEAIEILEKTIKKDNYFGWEKGFNNATREAIKIIKKIKL